MRSTAHYSFSEKCEFWPELCKNNLKNVFNSILSYRYKGAEDIPTKVNCPKRQQNTTSVYRTRKLCYRKDDRAMRHIHGCPENFRDSLTMPTAIIPNSFHALLFGSTLWMFLQNSKSVALSVPQIIGGTPKIWTIPGYALAPFSPKF